MKKPANFKDFIRNPVKNIVIFWVGYFLCSLEVLFFRGLGNPRDKLRRRWYDQGSRSVARIWVKNTKTVPPRFVESRRSITPSLV